MTAFTPCTQCSRDRVRNNMLLVRAEHSLTAFQVHATGLTPGKFPFPIYCWRQKGIPENLILQPISNSEEAQERFLALFARVQTRHNGRRRRHTWHSYW